MREVAHTGRKRALKVKMEAPEAIVEVLSVPLRDAKPLYVPLNYRPYLICEDDDTRDEPVLILVEAA